MKYRFAYIDRIKSVGRKTIEAHLGTLVHECLEHLYRDLQFEKRNTLSELLAFFDERWEAEWSDEISINKKEYSSTNYHLMGRRFITDYYNRNYPFDDGRTIFLEGRISISLEENDEADIVGFIDRLVQRAEGHYEIHDYKTSSSMPTQKDADQDRQLALYAIGIKQKYPDATNIDLVWHYLAFDKILKSHRSDEDLSDLMANITQLISKIEGCDDFPPNVTKLCDWCDYQPICPEFSHLFKIKSLPPEESFTEDGVQLVDRYWSLKEELKLKKQELEVEIETIEDKIVTYATQNNLNTIFGTQQKLKVIVSEDYNLPKKNSKDQKGLIDYLKDNGLWDGLTTLDNSALTKLLSGEEMSPDVKASLERMIPKQVKRSFRFRKIDSQ